MASEPGSMTSLSLMTEAETHTDIVTPQQTMDMTLPPSVTEAETQTEVLKPEPTIELSYSNETQVTSRFTLEIVRRWTSTDVQAWIEKNGLKE